MRSARHGRHLNLPLVKRHSGAVPAGTSGPLFVRRWPVVLVAALLVGAVLAPSARVSTTLVNLRLELLLWPLALPYLVRTWIVPALRMPGEGSKGGPIAAMRRLNISLVDLGFLALATITLLSILAAALRDGARISARDGFELIKLGLYWLAFRTALRVARDNRDRRRALATVVIAGGLSALLGIAQYFNLFGIVGATGHWWAEAHHLRELQRDGRSFGTVGNPNYFGALMATIAVLAGYLQSATRQERALPRGLVVAVAALATAAAVMSGSRGALGLFVVAATVPVLYGLVVRSPRAPFACALLLAVALIGAVGLVELFPRGRTDYLSRVAGGFGGGDNAVALRLERWRGAIIGDQKDTGAAQAGGQPASGTGRAAAGDDIRARDALRRADLSRLVDAVRRFHDRTGMYPAGPTLNELAPSLIPAIPTDPVTAAPYRYERTVSGFTVASTIEDSSDPDYPLLALGDLRNYIENGDLERADGERADAFRTIPGTVYRVAPEAGLFGKIGIVYGGSRAGGTRAAVYQQRAISRTSGAPFTASVWVKFPAAVRGAVSLYTNILYGDGTRQDPYARVNADSTLVGVWQRVSIVISPNANRRVDFLGVYLLSDEFDGEVYADGFELVDGAVPVTFPGLPEAATAPPGLDVRAEIGRSPILGSGPQKSELNSTLDNEYLLVTTRYGFAGLVAYLLLWVAVAIEAIRTARGGETLGMALLGIVGGLLVFNLVAGSLYQLQLMAFFWPLVGLVLARPTPAPAAAPVQSTSR